MKKRIWIVLAVALLACMALIAGCANQQGNPTSGIGTTLTQSICQLQGHTWQEATCVQPKACKICGVTEGAALGHTWKDATCTEAKTCEICAATEGEALGHTWQDATCTEAKVCKTCAASEGEALGHAWQDATCTEAKTCKTCAVTEGEALGHSWQDATCTAPKTCGLCGQTEGEVLAHSWQSATCQRPETCAGCGLTRGEKTDHQWKNPTCSKGQSCKYCGVTTGDALGHVWKEATCTTAKTCSTCGATSGSPLGHDLDENSGETTKLCKTCGQWITLKYIALTIDDGPSGQITDTLLEGLEARGAHATFFICGYRIRSFRAYPQKILDGGHEIGLHTDSHATLTKLDSDGVRKELEGMMGLLPEGYRVTLMRPPGGAYNNTVKAVCLDMGLSIIMWSVDPKDWATNDVDLIVSRIVNGASDGAIILMHDLKSSSVQAALKAIDKLQAQGYVFVTVSELAEIQGKTLEPGKVYSSVR